MQIEISLKKEVDESYLVLIQSLLQIETAKKVAIVTNPTVSKLHLEYLLKHINADSVNIVTVPDGEEYKTFQRIETILDALFSHKLDRKSILIGFGGGVVGDMTGFCASIFQRGIEFIQIPTTLLSQVDASVGGKTGVNNSFGKNLIGAFHQPKAVYIDTHFLSTLPKREYRAGIAEIIKMAVTFDLPFFEWLERADLYSSADVKEAIERSVRLKAGIVAQDEKERGIRAALNYGHTFAHVVENESGYGNYLHGEAVAIGMVMANKLAMKLGCMDKSEIDRIEMLLKKYELPTEYKIANTQSFYEAFFLDKKSSQGAIMFVLPNHIGGVEFRDNIPKMEVMALLNTYA